MPTLVSRKRNLKHSVPTATVKRLGNAMLRVLQLPQAELSVLLTDDPEIRGLNLEHRQKDRPTDVLSFPMQEGALDPSGILGDVVISLDTTARQANGRGRPLLVELRFLLAHGVLHLLGYDHGTVAEKRKMVAMTRRLVKGAPLDEDGSPRSAAFDARKAAERRPKARPSLGKGSK